MKHQSSRTGSTRIQFSILLATILLALSARPASAQQVCVLCSETKPFGGCALPSRDHAGEFPGSVAVLPDFNEAGDTIIYVADYYSGFTYVFNNVGGTEILDPVTTTLSPAGSRQTSGLAYRHNDDPALRFLYWAVGGERISGGGLPPNPRLLRTSFDLNVQETFEQATPIDLVALANLLQLPQVGTLGGITYHAQRNSFWGVDIVNDVYFEFDFSGDPVVENDEVVHFVNPSRGDRPGAYGNSITYVEVNGQPYFDIPHGPLSAGRATTVERVFARSGDENGLAVNFGDPTGHQYDLDRTIGQTGFVTGLGMIQDACNADQNIEIVLDIGVNTAEPKIHLVNADTPVASSRGVASFSCQSDGNNVSMTWRNYDALSSLEITRVDLLTDESTTVLSLPADARPGEPEFPSLAAGDHTFTDTRVSDGAYRYTIQVETVSGEEVDDLTSLVTIGRGQLVDSVDPAAEIFAGTGVDESGLSGLEYLTDLDRILLLDAVSGRGHLFDSDLAYKGSISGPFEGNFDFFGGTTISAAYKADGRELVWLYHFEGSYYLHRTTVVIGDDGEVSAAQIPAGEQPLRLRNPVNLGRAPRLGALTYDAVSDQFWTVDTLNQVAYSLDRDGNLTGQSLTSQLASPRADSGSTGPGLAVSQSTTSGLTLDWITGPEDRATEITRVSYIRSTGEGGVETIDSGTTQFVADLRGSTGSGDLGSLVITTEGESTIAYVLAIDTGRLLKVSLDEGISGKKFLRGDANADGSMNISDPSFILQHLFRGGRAPDCMDAADTNDDEIVDVSDAIYIFAYMFLGQAAPPEPFQECGFDLEPELPCARTICQD